MNAEALDPSTLICPACGKQQLRLHCPQTSGACRWLKCGSPTCDAVLDLPRFRGHRVNQTGPGREAFTFHSLDGSEGNR